MKQSELQGEINITEIEALERTAAMVFKSLTPISIEIYETHKPWRKWYER